MIPRAAWIVAALLTTHLSLMALYSPQLHRGDQVQYVRVASSILDHGPSGYFDPPFRVQRGDYFPYFRGDVEDPDGTFNPIFWDPLYPLFVALVFDSFGHSVTAVRASQIALSLGTLLLGVATVRRMFPDRARAPWLFGCLYVAYLPFAGFTTKVMAETLDTFLMAAILLCTTFLSWRRLVPLFVLGLLLGLYALTRSYFLQMMPLVILLIGALLWRDASREAGGRLRLASGLLLVVVGFSAALTPTLVRNANLTDGVLLISTKGAWNFWKDDNNLQLVTHDWRQPGLKVHPWLDAYYLLGSSEAVPRTLPHVHEDPTKPVRPPCDAPLEKVSACERNAAISWALEDPARFARRAIAKVANLWSPNNYIFNRAPEGQLAWHQNYRVSLPAWLRWLAQLYVIGIYVCVMVAFFAALLAPPESERDRMVRSFAVLSLLFLTLIVVPAGHGVSRFRLPFMLPVMMLATLGMLRGRAVLENLRGPAASPAWLRRSIALSFSIWAGIVLVKLPLLLSP